MKLKSLLVITLLVIGCSFASAQTFGFGTAGGDYLYCNYIQLSNVYGAPYAVWQGTDNLSACGHGYNATVVGVKGGLSKPGNPGGFAATGVTYADNIYDAYSYTLTGVQWDVSQSLKCTNLGAKKAKEAWIGFASVSGFVFGDNYGTVACSIPGRDKGAKMKGLSIGTAKAPKRK